MITRDVKDIEQHIYYKEEDKKYNIVLTNRSCKDELRKMKRKAKNNELKDIKKMIKDKELISD
jgi:hypothetical protein